MKIITHKSLNLTISEALAYIRKEKSLPEGVALNLTGDTAVIEPLDKCNILGILTDDYELLYYEEGGSDE